jgi:hypothetical protein
MIERGQVDISRLDKLLDMQERVLAHCQLSSQKYQVSLISVVAEKRAKHRIDIRNSADYRNGCGLQRRGDYWDNRGRYFIHHRSNHLIHDRGSRVGHRIQKGDHSIHHRGSRMGHSIHNRGNLSHNRGDNLVDDWRYQVVCDIVHNRDQHSIDYIAYDRKGRVVDNGTNERDVGRLNKRLRNDVIQYGIGQCAAIVRDVLDGLLRSLKRGKNHMINS